MKKPTELEKELAKQLNFRQQTFVLNLVKSNNQTQAAIEAGYSKKGACTQGSILLRNPKVVAYMEEVRKRFEEDKIADIQEVLQYYTKVMRGQELDQFELEPALTERTRAATELAKRLEGNKGTTETRINIINNIPRPEETETEEETNVDED